MRLVYYPYPVGSFALEFGESKPYGLIRASGYERAMSSPVTTRGAAQRGVTVIDSTVDPRTLAIQVLVTDETPAAYDAARSALVRSLLYEPKASAGAKPAVGVLQMYRNGNPIPIEWEVVPQSSPQESGSGPLWSVQDIQFLCPNPYPRAVEDSLVTLKQSGGGFTWPIQFALTIPEFNVNLTVVNVGDVSVPIVGRMYGDFTDGRLMNLDTGEAIGVTPSVPSGEFVEVRTEYGGKALLLNGNTSVPHYLSPTYRTFWQLKPGAQVVRFEATTNVSGSATITWRPRWGGA